MQYISAIKFTKWNAHVEGAKQFSAGVTAKLSAGDGEFKKIAPLCIPRLWAELKQAGLLHRFARTNKTPAAVAAEVGSQTLIIDVADDVLGDQAVVVGWRLNSMTDEEMDAMLSDFDSVGGAPAQAPAQAPVVTPATAPDLAV